MNNVRTPLVQLDLPHYIWECLQRHIQKYNGNVSLENLLEMCVNFGVDNLLIPSEEGEGSIETVVTSPD